MAGKDKNQTVAFKMAELTALAEANGWTVTAALDVDDEWMFSRAGDTARVRFDGAGRVVDAQLGDEWPLKDRVVYLRVYLNSPRAVGDQRVADRVAREAQKLRDAEAELLVDAADALRGYHEFDGGMAAGLVKAAAAIKDGTATRRQP